MGSVIQVNSESPSPSIEMFFLLRRFYVSGAETTVHGAETPVHAPETPVHGAET